MSFSMGLPFGSGCVAPSIVSPTGKPTNIAHRDHPMALQIREENSPTVAIMTSATTAELRILNSLAFPTRLPVGDIFCKAIYGG